MSIRLNKALRELNIGLQTAVEFLEKRKEIEIKHSIDLIQHFCFWLHENKYTKSVLSLLTNN